MRWYGELLDDLRVKVPKSLPPYIKGEDVDRLVGALTKKRTHKRCVERDCLLLHYADYLPEVLCDAAGAVLKRTPSRPFEPQVALKMITLTLGRSKPHLLSLIGESLFKRHVPRDGCIDNVVVSDAKSDTDRVFPLSELTFP